MKDQSIRNSILFIVTTSLLVLATLLFFMQSRNEIKWIHENTQSLVHEQIGLIVKSLDSYRMVDQVSYILSVTFNLDRVDGVNIYDHRCNIIAKQPINFNTHWDCQKPLPHSMVVYMSHTSISDSNGAPKYVLAHLKNKPSLLLHGGSLQIILASFILIVMTIFLLNHFIKGRILNPIDRLNGIIRKPGALKRNSQEQRALPRELREIYDEVLSRDEIIQQNKIELVKKNEMEIKNQINQQIAHDIRSPIMMLRDYHLKLYEMGKSRKGIYFDALNDLDDLTNQLFEQSGEYTREVDLVSLVHLVIDMKKTEFQYYFPKVNLSFQSDCDVVKIKTNPTKLKFVLSNVINNSREASDKYKPCDIQINLESTGNRVLIDIVDNGKGLKESDLRKVFDRGVSIDKPGGSGLGLYDARQFIEKEGGTIELKSQYKKGVLVRMTLPIILSSFQSHGKGPFEYVLIEDYKLSQLLWLQAASQRNLSFAVFSSPSEFLDNIHSISDKATIYLDSRFPDFPMLGQDWAKELYYKKGFKKIYMCSSVEITIGDKPWILGSVPKHKPFDNPVKERRVK